MRILATLIVVLLVSLDAAAFAFVVAPSSRRPQHYASSSSLQMVRGRRYQKTSHGIGKDWEGHWEHKYSELKAERMWRGGGKFYLKYSENPRLWDWLDIQKENLRRGVMRHDRRTKLSELGYTDSSDQKEQTSTRSTITAAAYEDYGLSYFAPTLQPIVTTTTTTKRNNSNIAATTTTSNSRGTTTTSWEKRWDDMYLQLQQFKERYGRTNKIPTNTYPKLANWVQIQKENLRRGVMRQDRRQRLLDLGLDFQF